MSPHNAPLHSRIPHPARYGWAQLGLSFLRSERRVRSANRFRTWVKNTALCWLEFTNAGIHHLIDRDNPLLPAHLQRMLASSIPHTRAFLRIGKTAPLCIHKTSLSPLLSRSIFSRRDFLQVGQEASIFVISWTSRCIRAEPLHYSKNTRIVTRLRIRSISYTCQARIVRPLRMVRNFISSERRLRRNSLQRHGQ